MTSIVLSVHEGHIHFKPAHCDLTLIHEMHRETPPEILDLAPSGVLPFRHQQLATQRVISRACLLIAILHVW